MSARDYIRREDNRLLGFIGALVLGLCLDTTARIWPTTETTEPSQHHSPDYKLTVTRPPPEELSTLLELLLPKQSALSKDEPTATKSEPELDEQAQEGILDQLLIDREEYKLRACFSNDQTSATAIIERTDKATQAVTLKKIKENEELGPYRLERINQTSVILSSPGGRTIELRLFKIE